MTICQTGKATSPGEGGVNPAGLDVFIAEKAKAGDPRNRLPSSQLGSPLLKGGASEGTEYMPAATLWQ